MVQISEGVILTVPENLHAEWISVFGRRSEFPGMVRRRNAFVLAHEDRVLGLRLFLALEKNRRAQCRS